MSQIPRRHVLLAAAALLAAPLAAGGQPAPKVARIGYLTIGALGAPDTRMSLDALRQGLRERGY